MNLGEITSTNITGSTGEVVYEFDGVTLLEHLQNTGVISTGAFRLLASDVA